MKISNVGLDLIKSFEGCQLKAYQCPAGIWTIGYGETGTFTLTGQKIVPGMTITKEQAEESFKLVLSKKGYENAVNGLGVELNQNQFDALVSFCYNLGTGIFKGSLENAIKNKNWSNVAAQMLLYNKARVNGKLTVLKGLERRRQAESALFLKPYTEDKQLKDAVHKIAMQFNINETSWNSVASMKMVNVPSLIKKLGGIVAINSRVTQKGMSFDLERWKYIISTGAYSANNVRALLIKYAATL